MQKLFNFKGKIGRLEYFITTLTTVIIFLMQIMLYSQVPENNPNNILLGIIILIMFIMVIWINFAAASKRFQDIGFSGWRCLLLLIPIVKIIVYLYLCSVASKKQVNLNTNYSSNIPSLSRNLPYKENKDNTFAIAICSITIIFIIAIIALIIIKG